MLLDRVKIRNFRSLQDVTIRFAERCRVLLGINESGKSNILKALALLDESRDVQIDDLREFGPDDDVNEEGYVRFVFKLDEEERSKVHQTLADDILSRNENTPLIRTSTKPLTLRELTAHFGESVYSIDLRTKKRSWTWWTVPDDYQIAPGWHAPAAGIPADVAVATSNGTLTPLKNFVAVHESCFEEKGGSLAPIAVSTLLNAIGNRFKDSASPKKPRCLYWTYSESQLLPTQISMETFSANPKTCEPLRQMFALAGFDNAAVAIRDAKARPNGIRNLLNRVADNASAHMSSVWKEYKSLKIELAPNGSNIEASIKDQHNLYNFERRSDGFKRFISFLLLVSAKVRNAELENTLYLHDEPDIGLHPSGARYVKDELIKISTNNYVVFSTHSIFMVDRERIDRHLIVRKSSEVTTVEEVDDSNIVDEEVLYNALGYSLFESLRPKSIIFEGWRDKRLFQVALTGRTPRARKLKKEAAEYGFCHAKGVRDVERITPMLELAGRKWIVVSDGDRVARDSQSKYSGAYPWVRYDELISSPRVTTGEDFIKAKHYRPVLQRIGVEIPSLPECDYSKLEASTSRLETVGHWLMSGGIKGDQAKNIVERVKQELFDNLMFSHIEDSYFDCCDSLCKRLKSI